MWTFERRDLAEEEGAIFEDLLISASETGLLEATIPHGPLFCSLKKMISPKLVHPLQGILAETGCTPRSSLILDLPGFELSGLPLER